MGLENESTERLLTKNNPDSILFVTQIFGLLSSVSLWFWTKNNHVQLRRTSHIFCCSFSGYSHTNSGIKNALIIFYMPT